MKEMGYCPVEPGSLCFLVAPESVLAREWVVRLIPQKVDLLPVSEMRPSPHQWEEPQQCLQGSGLELGLELRLELGLGLGLGLQLLR